MENKKYSLNFYGVTLSLCGDDEILSKLSCDFAFFLKDACPKSDITVNIIYEKPPYEKLKDLTASVYKTDCICYDYKNIRYVDYNRKCLCIYNKDKLSAEIYSLSKNLLYEISYLFIHSRVGELLDLKGFHRIHACAFSYEGFAYVLMLPQGAGKSTFLFSLLKRNSIKLLSDDTPIIDSFARLYPFPIRIGLCNDIDTSFIPKEHIYSFERRKFGDKKLLSYEYFKNLIEKEHLPIRLIYGKRIFSENSKIIKKNRIFAFKELAKNCIIGYGLPQVLEYFLTGGIKDIFVKMYIVLFRFYSCIVLLLKIKGTYCFCLSNNIEKNSEEFLNFFKKKS